MVLLVAASAAQREQHANAAQGLRPYPHPPFGYLRSTSSTSTSGGGGGGGGEGGGVGASRVQGAPRFEAYALQEGRGGGGVVRGRLTVAYVTSEWGDNSVGKEMVAVLAGTNFTCFTSTKYKY